MHRICPVIVGSKTDLDILCDSKMGEVFEACGVDWSKHIHIISAHRNLESDLIPFFKNFPLRRPRVVICGAGFSAALAGTVSGLVEGLVPVIGVAFSNGPSPLFGQAAVLSQICMPPGRPVLFAGIDGPGCYNAAIAACAILGNDDDAVFDMLRRFQQVKNRPAQLNVELPEKPAKKEA